MSKGTFLDLMNCPQQQRVGAAFSHDHEECDCHQSVMPGVCYCQTAGIVYVNPRLFSTGYIVLEDTNERDVEAFDIAEFMIEHWFPVLEDKWVCGVANDVQMPGMVAECDQVPGEQGHELVSRRP
jgi:hypothetical protein